MGEMDPHISVPHRQRYDFMKMNQPEAAKNIYVYLNGDQYFPCRKIVVNRRHVPDFDGFLNEVTQGIKAPFGAIRSIYTPTSGTRLHDLHQLQSGMKVVAGGVEKFRKLDYEEIGAKPRPKKQRNYLEIKIHKKMNVEARWRKYIKDPCQIYVYANGDMQNPAVRLLLIPRRMKTWDLILEEITEKIGFRTGRAVRKLYDLEHRLLTEPSELENGQYYVAVGTEKLKKLPYGEIPKHQLSPRRGPHVPLPPIKGTGKKVAALEDGGKTYSKMYTQKKQLAQSQDKYVEMKSSAATGNRPLKMKLSKPQKPLDPTQQEAESVILAKPVRVKRSGGPSVPAHPQQDQAHQVNPFDSRPPHDETDGVYRSKIRQIKAAEVDEDEDVQVDLPIDQIPADEIEEERIPVRASFEETPPETDVRKDSILEASFTKEEHGSDSDHKPFDSHLLDPIAREDNNQSGDEKTQKDEANLLTSDDSGQFQRNSATFDDVADTAEPLSIPSSRAGSALEILNNDVMSTTPAKNLDDTPNRTTKASVISRKSNVLQSTATSCSSVGGKSSSSFEPPNVNRTSSKVSKPSVVSRKSDGLQVKVKRTSLVEEKPSVSIHDSRRSTDTHVRGSKKSLVSGKSFATDSGSTTSAKSKTSKALVVSRKSDVKEKSPVSDKISPEESFVKTPKILVAENSNVKEQSSVSGHSSPKESLKRSKASIVSRKSSVKQQSSVSSDDLSPKESPRVSKDSVVSRKLNNLQSGISPFSSVEDAVSSVGSSATSNAPVFLKLSTPSQSVMQSSPSIERKSRDFAATAHIDQKSVRNPKPPVSTTSDAVDSDKKSLFLEDGRSKDSLLLENSKSSTASTPKASIVSKTSVDRLSGVKSPSFDKKSSGYLEPTDLNPNPDNSKPSVVSSRLDSQAKIDHEKGNIEGIHYASSPKESISSAWNLNTSVHSESLRVSQLPRVSSNSDSPVILKELNVSHSPAENQHSDVGKPSVNSRNSSRSSTKTPKISIVSTPSDTSTLCQETKSSVSPAFDSPDSIPATDSVTAKTDVSPDVESSEKSETKSTYALSVEKRSSATPPFESLDSSTPAKSPSASLISKISDNVVINNGSATSKKSMSGTYLPSNTSVDEEDKLLQQMPDSRKCSISSKVSKTSEQVSVHTDDSAVLLKKEASDDKATSESTSARNSRFSSPGEMSASVYDDKMNNMGEKSLSITDVTVSSITSLKIEGVHHDIPMEDQSKSLDEVDLVAPTQESGLSLSLNITESKEDDVEKPSTSPRLKTPYTLINEESGMPAEESHSLLLGAHSDDEEGQHHFPYFYKNTRFSSSASEDSQIDQNDGGLPRPSGLTVGQDFSTADTMATKHAASNGNAVSAGAVSPS